MNKNISLHNVSYSISGKNILENINLSFPIKETTLILGDNGSGKTTLIDALTDNVKITSGSITFSYDKKNVGVLFDSIPFVPELKVKEVVKYYKLIYCEKIEAVDFYLRKLNLNNALNKKVKVLSLGEKKRLGLFTALFHKSELLILDEPFGGIDPNSLNTISKLIAEKKDVTKIVSSHNWDIAKTYADKICFIYKGRILDQLRSPEEFLSDKFVNYKQKLVVRESDIDEDLNDKLKKFSLTLKYDSSLHLFFENKKDIKFIESYTKGYTIQNKNLNDIYHFLITQQYES